MNVAYLLVSSAWLAGQPPAPTTTAPVVNPAPIMANSAGYGGAGIGGAGCGCGGGCDSCCDDGCCGGSSWGHRFKNRMRGLFNRGGHGGGCCDTCAPTTCCAPAQTSCCAPTTSCGCCDSCCEGGNWGHRFKNRMRGLFRRGHGNSCDCCNTGCDGCGSGCAGGGCAAPYGAPVMGGAQQGERIPAPKDGNLNKMPAGGNPPAKSGQVQINIAPTAPIPASAPALETAPAVPAPAANSEERPF